MKEVIEEREYKEVKLQKISNFAMYRSLIINVYICIRLETSVTLRFKPDSGGDRS